MKFKKGDKVKLKKYIYYSDYTHHKGQEATIIKEDTYRDGSFIKDLNDAGAKLIPTDILYDIEWGDKLISAVPLTNLIHSKILNWKEALK